MNLNSHSRVKNALLARPDLGAGPAEPIRRLTLQSVFEG